MNKTQLVDALALKLGDRRSAVSAVDGVLDTIVETVTAGDSVSITGFGVFEPRARAARVARNPRTGETVDVAATTVPAFRPGAGFRSSVSGTATVPAPRATPTRSRTAATPAAPKAEGSAAESATSGKPAKARTAKAGKAAPKSTTKETGAGKAKKAKAKK